VDLTGFRRDKVPARSVLPAIGRFLLASLGAYLGRELSVFREHYVDDGSVVLTFQAPLCAPLDLALEGVLLFSLPSSGAPPLVDAELLLFGGGGRLGPSGRGLSYLTVRYDVAVGAWAPARWLGDGPEDWERITAPRTGEYSSVRTSWDFD
jgi:hypothetical protein